MRALQPPLTSRVVYCVNVVVDIKPIYLNRRYLLLKPEPRPWTWTLDPDPEKPGLRKTWTWKTWTQKNLDPKKPGLRKTWTLKILNYEKCEKQLDAEKKSEDHMV